ncbi:Bcr/CflA family drug resistance efflux transporter [Microtetraspora sp. NBRC 13810]|uniref:MFS transporter n=1 Tax=Microtetraspora sp. NBRC 13810 TaxID=3030990 RepID=UPI0024A5E560|nr:MFS transporter [Microtetraspora sp. NBRC 13810]GLW10728.1 Bcr/CflA family drug resistance efflux transporter [Microtetraspora sp. NBRC 13810]
MGDDAVDSGAAVTGRARLTRAVALPSFGLLVASYVVNSMDRQVFPALVPHIGGEYGFTPGQGDLLVALCTVGIGAAGIPAGFLLDRFSRKAVMLAGILIYSVFTLLTTMSLGLFDMSVYRALSGVGESLQGTALFAAVGAYFFARRALAVGGLNFAYGLGGLLGPLAGAGMDGATGTWRSALWVYGLLGLGFVVLIAALVGKVFTEHVGRDRRPVRVYEPGHAQDGLLNRNVVMLASVAMVVGVTMYGYIGLYPTYLQEKLGFTAGQAGLAAGMFGLGALAGPVAGWLGDRFDQRTIMIAALIAGSAVGYLLFNGPTTVGPQVVLSFAEGAIASGFLFVNIYSAMQRSVRPDLIGRVSGVYMASFFVPAGLAGYLFSALVDSTGWSGAGFLQLTLLPLIALMALLFVDGASAAPR